MVTKLGFSEKIGYISLSENRYGKKNYSEVTNRIIDEECNLIINRCVDKVRVIIKDKRELINELAKKLLAKKTLELKDIEGVLGKRPFAPKSSFKAYLEEINKDEVDEEIVENEQNSEKEDIKEDSARNKVDQMVDKILKENDDIKEQETIVAWELLKKHKEKKSQDNDVDKK